MGVGIDAVLDRIIGDSVDVRQQGTRWERVVRHFFRHDPAWSDRFEHVWMRDDAPEELTQGQRGAGSSPAGPTEKGGISTIPSFCFFGCLAIGYTSGTSLFLVPVISPGRRCCLRSIGRGRIGGIG